jgi:hypothetical protein
MANPEGTHLPSDPALPDSQHPELDLSLFPNGQTAVELNPELTQQYLGTETKVIVLFDPLFCPHAL